jgi:protein O-mannosyl-transferase
MGVVVHDSEKPRWAVPAVAATLALATFAVYANSLGAPFIFDDRIAVLENESIRRLWPVWEALSPPSTAGGAAGRPLVNLSFALNRALGGEAAWGYHVFNVLVHACAGLVLFGLVRRTLHRASESSAEDTPRRSAAPLSRGDLPDRRALGVPSREGWPRACGAGVCWRLRTLASTAMSEVARRTGPPWRVAAIVALLWIVHPLQTESVTCVVQRTESLLGLFFLLTLYAFVRAAEVESRAAAARWQVACVVSCLAGMATKEVMAAAPLLVFLYDRTFLAGTWREAWRRRWPLHALLTGTWLLLAWLVAGAGQRGGAAGFGQGVAWWEYLLTQCRALVVYLKLAFWPHPLVLDFGREVVRDPLAVWWQGGLVVVLAIATLWAIVRRPAAGFPGAWFFCILAPSSSVVPLVTQTMAEHRMYLPLAAPVVAVTLAAAWLWHGRGLLVLLAAAAGLGALTVWRNHDYRSEVAIWEDTVAKTPGSARARYNLGAALDAAGRRDDAMRAYREALRLEPRYAAAHFNLGADLVEAGDVAGALRHFEATVQLEPDSFDGHINLGNTLLLLDRVDDALSHLSEGVRLAPGAAAAHFNLGRALVRAGRVDDAIVRFREAVRLQPADAESHFELGSALARSGRLEEAVIALRAATVLDRDHSAAQANLGTALLQLGRPAEAVTAFEQAVRLQPENVRMREALAVARKRTGLGAPAIGGEKQP